MKDPEIYFGHPVPFWTKRHNSITKASEYFGEYQNSANKLEFELNQSKKAIKSRTSEKVRQLLDHEDLKLQRKKERLKTLIRREDEKYAEEIHNKESLQDYNYINRNDRKTEEYMESIEREKARECQAALERKKISKGMMCTKEDEIQLKEMQRMQMLEKRRIEDEENEIELMWHQKLVEGVKRKERLDRQSFEKRQREMVERRQIYDVQIASANQKRRQALNEEREKENIRLEKIKKKMEQDHYDAIKKKKQQQEINAKNFIEGHTMKAMRILDEKREAREIDNGTIKVALRELEKEKERNRVQMKNLRVQSQIFFDNIKRERKIANDLEKDISHVINEWDQEQKTAIEVQFKNQEEERKSRKEKALEDYRSHIKNKIQETEIARQNRAESMKRVNRLAKELIIGNLQDANEELRKQTEYRNNLSMQIYENQKTMANELETIECKQKPFTKRAELFEDMMNNSVDKSPGRSSTNPVHPFKKIINSNIETKLQLPSIGQNIH